MRDLAAERPTKPAACSIATTSRARDLHDAAERLTGMTGTGTTTRLKQRVNSLPSSFRAPARIIDLLKQKVEAPPGFEPGVEVLQSYGLPQNVRRNAKLLGIVRATWCPVVPNVAQLCRASYTGATPGRFRANSQLLPVQFVVGGGAATF